MSGVREDGTDILNCIGICTRQCEPERGLMEFVSLDRLPVMGSRSFVFSKIRENDLKSFKTKDNTFK